MIIFVNFIEFLSFHLWECVPSKLHFLVFSSALKIPFQKQNKNWKKKMNNLFELLLLVCRCVLLQMCAFVKKKRMREQIDDVRSAYMPQTFLFYFNRARSVLTFFMSFRKINSIVSRHNCHLAVDLILDYLTYWH